MSCHLKHMAAAACGQCTKSQRNSGWSPSTKGGGPNWEKAERLDGSSGLYLTGLCVFFLWLITDDTDRLSVQGPGLESETWDLELHPNTEMHHVRGNSWAWSLIQALLNECIKVVSLVGGAFSAGCVWAARLERRCWSNSRFRFCTSLIRDFILFTTELLNEMMELTLSWSCGVSAQR